MFSSENNSYPLFYHQSPSFVNAVPENNNIFIQHHNNGKYNYIFPPTYPQISENPIFKLSSEPSINQEDAINYPSNIKNRMGSSRRSTGKKDRHTKICTAQGVRDRRVRLSMSIAREFFNLQDMLGFDKASKTLGWLLTKSKAAIDELASTSNFKKNETTHEDTNDEKKDLEGKSTSKRKRKENYVNPRNVAKEMRRQEARKRARERTQKKKIVDDHKIHHYQLEGLDHHHHHHRHHQRVEQDLMILQSNSATTQTNITPSYGKGLVSVGESVVIKGNNTNKSRGSSYCYNCEMISSKDNQEIYDYENDYLTKSAPENCNYGGIMQLPGFPALNIINLSTEIHINARPWDTYSNQILH